MDLGSEVEEVSYRGMEGQSLDLSGSEESLKSCPCFLPLKGLENSAAGSDEVVR